MSNFDYHFGYSSMSRGQYRIALIKHWFTRMCKVGVLILLAYLFYRIFIYNPIPNLEARSSESIEIISFDQNAPSLENTLKDQTIDNTHKETFNTQEVSNITKNKEPILFVQETPSIKMADLPKDNTSEDLANSLIDTKNNLASESIENNIVDDTPDLQSNPQISRIIKQIELDRKNKQNPSTLISANNLLVKNTKAIKDIKTQVLNNNKSNVLNVNLINASEIYDKKQSAFENEATPQALSNIQKRYEQDLNRLSNEAELENLLKNSFSNYLDN